MEELLREVGFSGCEDDPDTLEFTCEDEEYVSDLAEALGVPDDVQVIVIQVTLSDGSAFIYADDEQYDADVNEVLDAVRDVFS